MTRNTVVDLDFNIGKCILPSPCSVAVILLKLFDQEGFWMGGSQNSMSPDSEYIAYWRKD